MKNKKGFTLIELLAVIVILAIIAVIATPIILGVIDDARTSAAEDSAYGALDAIKSYYATSQISASPAALPLTINFATPADVALLSMSGTVPTAGSVTLSAAGAFTVTGLTVNGYTCTYTSGAFSCS
ncbi:MAG: prepilin-type N-terminal cleavage/methylation domain-containing protein [Bacilli bacterium]|nr:prepilin-type N-terminal cleavage/methylation domain-containing protein [Bacilli bacterium]